jgi:glycosyltransferase involved in cell wall biosynthesis
LIEVDDEDALGDAVEALVNDPARRRSMGLKGRQEAISSFNSRENTRRLLEFVVGRC